MLTNNLSGVCAKDHKRLLNMAGAADSSFHCVDLSTTAIEIVEFTTFAHYNILASEATVGRTGPHLETAGALQCVRFPRVAEAEKLVAINNHGLETAIAIHYAEMGISNIEDRSSAIITPNHDGIVFHIKHFDVRRDFDLLLHKNCAAVDIPDAETTIISHRGNCMVADTGA